LTPSQKYVKSLYRFACIGWKGEGSLRLQVTLGEIFLFFVTEIAAKKDIK
jgi:hypothetical protein